MDHLPVDQRGAPGDGAQYEKAGSRGGQQSGRGNNAGRRGGSQASASSLRGSYSAPDSPGEASLGPADSGYGAPPPLTGYGARRRNARERQDYYQDYQEI